MEHVGELMMSEGEWNNVSHHEIYSSSSPDEEGNFMAQLLGHNNQCPLPSDNQYYWPVQESAKMNQTSIYSSSSDEYNHHFHSQGCSTNGFSNDGCFLSPPSSSSGHKVFEAENGALSMDYYYAYESKNPESSDMIMETNNNGDDFLIINQDYLCIDECMESNGINLHLGRAHDEMMTSINNIHQSHSSGDEKLSSPSSDIISKKRPRLPPVDNKNKRSLKQKRNQKLPSSCDDHEEEHDDEQIGNAEFKRENSMTSCFSTDEDDSLAPSRSSSKRDGNGKSRANRGSATDPQSLYARKRRERINERLKILQNLVPNGTKVDISTMLEEAVQYVKFLQLQIKLLSSDDLWMYSPIAYNGMDIGLDLKIATAAKSFTK